MFRALTSYAQVCKIQKHTALTTTLIPQVFYPTEQFPEKVATWMHLITVQNLRCQDVFMVVTDSG